MRIQRVMPAPINLVIDTNIWTCFRKIKPIDLQCWSTELNKGCKFWDADFSLWYKLTSLCIHPQSWEYIFDHFDLFQNVLTYRHLNNCPAGSSLSIKMRFWRIIKLGTSTLPHTSILAPPFHFIQLCMCAQQCFILGKQIIHRKLKEKL